MIAFIRKTMNKMGFDLIRTRNARGSFDAHLNNVLDKYSVECVLEVGANTGQYGASLRGMGYVRWIDDCVLIKKVVQVDA